MLIYWWCPATVCDLIKIDALVQEEKDSYLLVLNWLFSKLPVLYHAFAHLFETKATRRLECPF